MAEHNQLLSDEEIAKLQAKHTEHVCSMDQPPMSVLHIKSFVADVIAAHTAKLLESVSGEVVAWRWRFLNQPDKTWRHCERRPNFDPAVVDGEPLVPATALAAARAEVERLQRELGEATGAIETMEREIAGLRSELAQTQADAASWKKHCENVLSATVPGALHVQMTVSRDGGLFASERVIKVTELKATRYASQYIADVAGEMFAAMSGQAGEVGK